MKGEDMAQKIELNPIYKQVCERDGGRCCVCGKLSYNITRQTKADFNYLNFFQGAHIPTASDVVTVCDKCTGDYALKRQKYDKINTGTVRNAPYLQLTADGWLEIRQQHK